jgi:hypothetical protein
LSLAIAGARNSQARLTYVAGALLAGRYAEWSIVGSFVIFVCFLVVYHYAYEFLFPRFQSRGRLGKLGAFFGAQIAFWALVLYALSIFSVGGQ